MLRDNAKATALSHLRVLDLTDEKGMYCGKLLADMGADVINVERPGGDRTRQIGPFYHNEPDPQRSLYFWHYNTNKRGITLDLESARGQDIFRRLAQTADVVLETFPPGYLDDLGLGYAALSALSPRLIVTSITGFGQTGPYASYKCPDIVGVAMGGMMNISGEPDRPPLRPFGGQAYHTASHYAAMGTLAALYSRWATGQGQHIDISTQESIASCLEHVHTWLYYAGIVFQRQDGLHWTNTICLFAAKDGHELLVTGPNTNGLFEWLGPERMGNVLADIRAEDPFSYLNTLPRFFREVGAPWVAEQNVRELFQTAQQKRLAFAPCYSPKEMVEDPHLNARGFFVPVVHPELNRTVVYPGAPYVFSKTPWRIDRPAPLIGQHNDEILGQELGLGKDEIAEVTEPVARQEKTGLPKPGSRAKLEASAPGRKRRKPLEGVKVVDFTWVLAGPFASRILAFLGAEVIKIEPREVGDRSRLVHLNVYKDGNFGVNASGMFNNINPSKLGMTLNVNTPEGQAIVKKLVARADVVLENFSARVMKKWGLDYENLTTIKPDIIMVSMSGLGKTGPYKDYVSYGPTLHALSGFTYLTGYADSGPVGLPYSYSDHVGGIYGALATLIALEHHRRTGQGQSVDLSQLEATCALMETVVLDYTVNGRSQERTGNRLANFPASPHGAYHCRGNDRWLAIAVFEDEEWQALRQAIGEPDWSKEERFQTAEGRVAHADELDRLLEAWTIEQDPFTTMRRLQEAGVPAGVVQSAADMYCRDPQLRERGFFVEMTHPEIGQSLVENVPIKLSDTPGGFDRPAPLLGEHNGYILREILKLSEDEVNELILREVI